MTEDQERLLQDLLNMEGRLSELELEFIGDLDSNKALSPKQQVKLNDLGLKFDLGGVL